MSIATNLQKLETDITNAYDAVQTKGGTIPSDKNTNNLATAINSISGGSATLITKSITQNGTYNASSDNADGYSQVTVNVSGGGTVEPEEKDVNFYDYDGTRVYSYTKEEFLALQSMPENPTHTGLTAQGWNWTLSDAQNFVEKYNELDIGQIYATTSGLSEFDIELNDSTGLSITFNMNGTKDWGDGTTDTSTSHSYSTAGNYTIKCDGTTITATSSAGMFGQGSYIYYVKSVRLNNITVIPQRAFSHLGNLKYITIPSTVTSLGERFLYNAVKISIIILPSGIRKVPNVSFSGNRIMEKCLFPKSVTSIGNSVFESCNNIKKIIIPDNTTSVGSSCFNSNYTLKKIIISNSVTTLGQSAFATTTTMLYIKMSKNITSFPALCFSGAFYIDTIDFRDNTSIPTISNSNAFSISNKLCKIIVPDNLYENWKTTNNWSTYADYIIKSSDYNE